MEIPKVSQVNIRPGTLCSRSPSRTISQDNYSTCDTAFEQNDCGTIKKMPCDLMDSSSNGMQRYVFANNAVAQTYMLRHSTSTVSSNSGSKNSIHQVNEDDDSDEEILPPPPPEVTAQRTPTPQQHIVSLIFVPISK